MISSNIHPYSIVACLCSLASTCLAAEPTCTNACNGNAAVEGKVIGSNATELVVELTVTATNAQGVPMLDKIPYVSRLFKNVGTGSVTRTIIIPKCPSEPISEVTATDAVMPAAALSVEEEEVVPDKTANQTLPSPYYLQDEIQYLPNKDAVETSGESCPRTWSESKEIRAVAHESKCKQKFNAKPRPVCLSENSLPCACRNHMGDKAADLREQLTAALVENAELRVLAEAQAEIAEVKLESMRELNAIRSELASYQARLSPRPVPYQNTYTAPVAPSPAKRPGQPVPAPELHKHPQLMEQLKIENSALKRRIAELERQLNIVH